MMELEAFRAPLVAAGLATVALGIAIGVRGQLRAAQALGLLLVVKGSNLLAAGLLSSQWLEAVYPLLVFQQYLLIAMVPLVLYVAWAYVGRPGGRYVGPSIIGSGVFLELLYLFNHSLAYTLTPGEGENGLQVAGPGWVYSEFGPLVFLIALANAALATLAIVFARQATRGEPKQRVVAFWFAVGFIVNGVFDGGMAIAYLIHDPAIGGVSGLGWILGVSRSLALLPAGIALGILVGSELAKPHPQRWRWAFPAMLALAAWFSGPMPVIFGAADYGQTWPTAVATGLWRAALPALMGVGLWQLHVASQASSPARTPAARPVADEA